MSSDNIQFGHFKILKTLGKGSSASVKLAENLETNEFVALKILKLGRLDRFNAEVDSLTRITAHPNVVQVFGTTAKATYQRKNKPPIDVAYIEMEYCAKGELFDFLYNLHAFPESVAKRCTREIALGLEKVHQQNLAHRDLKPENILITSTYQLKISDFGFATLVLSDGSKHLRSFRGTRGYMAPEILKKEAYQGHQTDVFSLGVVIFILFTGRPPFTSAEVNNSFYRYIQADRWSDFWSRNEHIPGTPNFSPEFKDLMQHMLCVRPTDRFSCAQVLEHAWLATGVCENEEMVDWLSRHIVPEIITPHSNTEDSSYRTLQLTWQGSSDTSCEGDEPGLFRYSSRVSPL